MKLYIGLMSGTSMDGIDAALIDLTSNTFIQGITCPYGKEVKERLQEALATKAHSLGYYNQLNTLLGREFAKAALNLLTMTEYCASDIVAIGSHGQTFCHDSTAIIPYTVQLGCAHTIAEMTGITVVADFRTRDLVAGGQGAPFAPLYHQAIFTRHAFPLAVVNIGGIANLSYLANELDVKGYDTGPGNCLMDAWVFKHLQMDYDNRGEWALSGCIIDALLASMLSDPYFQRQYPKSIGKEYFSLNWLIKQLSGHEAATDVQATLMQFTAITIAREVNALPCKPGELYVCGGGARNQALLNALEALLPDTRVLSTQTININPDFVEALMFAWLAEKAINNKPLNLYSITGARHPIILGAIYPAGIDKRNSYRV